jgi:hypothetical protein
MAPLAVNQASATVVEIAGEVEDGAAQLGILREDGCWASNETIPVGPFRRRFFLETGSMRTIQLVAVNGRSDAGSSKLRLKSVDAFLIEKNADSVAVRVEPDSTRRR